MNEDKTERFEFAKSKNNIDYNFLNNNYSIDKFRDPYINKNNLNIRHNFNPNNIPTLKYLGILLDHKLSFKEHINYLIKWSNNQFQYIKNLIFEGIPLKVSTIYFIYRNKVRQKLEYGSSIYANINKNNISKLQIIQNKFIRLSFGIRKSTPVDAIHIILVIQKIKDRIEFFIAMQKIRSLYSFQNHPLKVLDHKHNINKNISYNNNNISYSVLFKGNQILQKYEHPLINVSYKIIPQPFKSLYIYNNNIYTKKIFLNILLLQ